MWATNEQLSASIIQSTDPTLATAANIEQPYYT